MNNSVSAAEMDYFLNQLHLSFKNAEIQTNGRVDKYYNIGGLMLRVCSAGPALTSIFTKALNHVLVDPCKQPDFTIYTWDTASTCTKYPDIPQSITKILTEAEEGTKYIRINNEVIEMVYESQIPFVSFINKKQRVAYFWLNSLDNIPYWFLGSPFWNIISSWLTTTNLQLVHAAAVGTSDGAALFTGKGGSGKSTTAMASLQGDLQYIGEDFCLLKLDSEPTVATLYNSAKFTTNTIEKFPQYIPYITNSDRAPEDKALLFFHNIHPEKTLYEAPIKALFALNKTHKTDTTITAVSSGKMLRELAISTVFQLGTNSTKTLKVLSELVKRVPAYMINLGTDLAQIPEQIQHVLREKS